MSLLSRPTKSFPCVLCGGLQFRDIMAVGSYWRTTRAVACASCGLMCLNPRWTDDEYAIYYTGYYYQQYHRGSVTVADRPSENQDSRSAVVARTTTQLLEASSDSARVLEVGCGAGQNLVPMMAASPSHTFFGLDPDPTMCADLSQKYPHLAMMVGTLSSSVSKLREQGPFDVVVLGDVLEHFCDPVEALSMVRAILKPSGQIVCLVPNLEVITPFCDNFTVPHTHYFTRRTLEAVHLAAGLKITSFLHDLPGELCSVATVGARVEWAGVSDVATVERRTKEAGSGRTRAAVRTFMRRLIERVVQESTVYRLQNLVRSLRR